MELCTGGSLFNILDDPENSYGLEEKEFLLVLSHLSAGMKHLRDNNLVHRDLKPGNIMKFICDDGSIVYKLADFGAARELHEGQQFASLYGTEEYLHPDMYERAVLRKPVGKMFGVTVDLWSIGVTLYHVATGNLPYRPYGGRRNKETMYHITTTKASGVISGIQTKDNGPIEWSRELPVNCQLSAGLKKIVTPLLAGLLEADPKRVWSFEKFFNDVVVVLSCKVINIFHVNLVNQIKVYIHPEEKFEELQAYVQEQTDISSEDQILLYRDELFENVVGKNTTALGYPVISEEEPLILFHKENNNVSVIHDLDLPSFQEFPNLVSVENDASQAKLACSIGHVCKRRIERKSSSCTLMHSAVNHFTAYILQKLKRLYLLCIHLKDMVSMCKENAEAIKLGQSLANCLVNCENQLNFTDYVKDMNVLSESFISESSVKVQQLHQRIVTDNTLKLEWESSSRLIKNPAETLAPARAKTLVDRLRDSWQHLVRDRATRSLSYNDEQFHVLERIKITETIKTIKSLLDSECGPAFNHLAETLGDWYKIAQTIYLQTAILDKDISVFGEDLRELSSLMKIEAKQYKKCVRSLLEQVPDGVKVPEVHLKSQHKKLHNSVKQVEDLTQEIMMLLHKHTENINKMDEVWSRHRET